MWKQLKKETTHIFIKSAGTIRSGVRVVNPALQQLSERRVESHRQALFAHCLQRDWAKLIVHAAKKNFEYYNISILGNLK